MQLRTMSLSQSVFVTFSRKETYVIPKDILRGYLGAARLAAENFDTLPTKPVVHSYGGVVTKNDSTWIKH